MGAILFHFLFHHYFRSKGRKPAWLESDNSEKQPGIGTERQESNLGQNSENEKLSRKNSESDSDHCEEDGVDEEDSDNSDLNNTSLSITKHVPSDIVDDSVDDLVAQAELILKDACIDSSTESEFSEVDGTNKETTRNAHKYLSASEMIDYHQDKVYIESEEDGIENYVDNKNESKLKQDSKHCDVNGEHCDINNSLIVDRDDSDKCWCNSLRTLDLTVPDEVTVDWLFNLSLVTIPEQMRSSIPNIISDMQEKIEIDDPQEEFKQLKNVPITDDCTIATLPNNRLKNRFRNVLPCKYYGYFL